MGKEFISAPKEMAHNYVHEIYRNYYKQIDAVMISFDVNIRFFTGANVSDAILLAMRSGWCYLFVDSRYYEEALKTAKQCKVILLTNRKKQLTELFKEHSVKELAIEADQITIKQFKKLKNDFPDINFIVDEFVSDTIRDIRAIKKNSEVEKIKKAQEISEEALNLIIKNDIAEGVTEIQLAVKYYEYITSLGAEKTSFDTIILFGENSSKPHGIPTNRRLKKSDNILIDCGAVFDGYCSDMTRNFVFGTPSEEYVNIYNIVLEAQKRALNAAKCHAKTNIIDSAAREYIKEHGFGDCFGHATGHGVGMEIHEFPSLSSSIENVLSPGMIVTVEPGIYLPEKFGIRIEDLIEITDDSANILSDFSKELNVL